MNCNFRKKYKLRDLVKIKYGKNQKKVVSEFGDIPIYGTGGLMGYATKYLYNKPSVLIGRKGSIGKVKYVEHPFWTVDTLFYTEVNADIVIPRYLFYKMSLIDLNIYNEGTTIPSLRTETLNRLTFQIPSIREQIKILNIIKPLDDKIELNNKINKNLEEMAQAIFKSWFVDFEPWGGEMPDDWEYGTLDEICEISSGKRPKVKSKNKTLDNTIPIIGASSIMGYTNKSLYNESLLITGRVGTHGIIQKLQKECWPSDNTLVIKSIFYNYTYQLLSKINYKNLNRGSTQPLITQTDLKKIPIVRPTDKILFAFEKLTNTFINKNILNNKQNQNLKLLRNTLLPKLMSGELDVSNLDI